MHAVSEDYNGRQRDLEILQTVVLPRGRYDMSLSSIAKGQRQVTGIQKAIQRYVSLLLNPGSTVRFGGSWSNMLLSELSAGRVPDTGRLGHLFGMASSDALDAMRSDDYNTERYGDLPRDERIASVTLDGMSVDTSTSTVSLSLTFETEAGSDYTYIIPISPGQA